MSVDTWINLAPTCAAATAIDSLAVSTLHRRRRGHVHSVMAESA